jgi:prepilin-type N-terminal cleavage/methylation domain-containing protein
MIMRSKQSGFTLVEIAIVLVIIGLLLGGVLKGQELINSAKVKNLAQDFRNVPLFIYGYQDKFRALPGDDPQVVAHVTGTLGSTAGQTPGNGVIEGAWDSSTNTDESYLFWQHVRLAGLAAGPTAVGDTNYMPRNADGGIIGITTNSNTTPYIAGMKGTYLICSTSLLGKYVKQLDATIDDGCPNTGSLRAVLGAPAGTTNGNVSVGLVPIAAGAICPITAGAVMDDSASYTVCLAL